MRVLAVLLLIRLLGGNLAAEVASDAQPSLRSSETINVDFADEEIATVLRNVTDRYELNLSLPEDLSGRVTLKVTNVTWREVFFVLLNPRGYTYREYGNIIGVEQKPGRSVSKGATEKRADFDFQNKPVAEALLEIAQRCELPSFTAQYMRGTVSLKLRDVTGRQAMGSVLCSLGYSYRERGGLIHVVQGDFPTSEP